MNVSEWVCVPREPTEHMKNCGRTENSERGHLLSEAAYRAMLAAAPSPAPVPVDPAELEALRRDAARWRWLDSRTDHTWEKLSRLSHALTRDYIDRQIAALAANGEKVG